MAKVSVCLSLVMFCWCTTESLLDTVPLRRLVLDTTDMMRFDLAVLLGTSPNLTDLKLHITPLDLAQCHNFLPDEDAFYSAPHSRKSLPIHPEMVPHTLESLSLNFVATEIDQEKVDSELFMKDFKQFFKSFLSNFRTVKKLNLYNTSFLSASCVVFGGIEAALEELQDIKHLTIIACNYISSEDILPDEDNNGLNSPISEDLDSQSHYSKVRLLLPCLQRESTFQSLCRLETLELDALYLSPRVDRMVAALRASGVLVNIFHSFKMTPISESLFSKADKKKFCKYANSVFG